MKTKTVIKLLTLSAFLVLQIACGDSDEVFIGSGAENDTSPSETNATDNNDSNSVTSDARPQYVTSDCGSLPISDAAPSTQRSAPTTFTAGQLVSGRIDPDSSSNFEHFWRIALQPGEYNVVFDSETVAGDFRNLNTSLTDLNGPDSEDGETLIKFNETNFRARYHEFIEIEQPRIVNLVVATGNRAEDYRFAIFRNGSPVPSPVFIDCPTIEPLSLDTTEALRLPVQTSATGDRWYLVDLEAKDYVLNSQAAITNCEEQSIEYDIAHVDQFGQASRMIDNERIIVDDTNAIGSTSVKILESGPVWIRIQNHECAINLEFTLNAES